MLNQKDSYCVFGKSNSVILGMSTTSASLYREVNRSTLMVAAYLIGLSLLMITFISKDMDRYILEGISSIHNKLAKITRGKSGHQGRGGQHAGIQGIELPNQQNGRESFGYHQQDIKKFWRWSGFP